MNQFTYFSLPRIVPEFLAGTVIGILRIRYPRVGRAVATAILLFSGVLFAGLLYNTSRIDALCPLVFCGMIFSLSYSTYVDVLFDQKILIFLGNISFAFYIFQFITFIIVEQLFSRLHGIPLGAMALSLLELVAALGINFIFASMSYQYYEEPVRKFLVKKFTRL